MKISRRALLATGAAAIILPKMAFSQSMQTLTAIPGKQSIAPEGYPDTEIWGYEGGVPGPMIRVAQGDRITREFVNKLPQGSSVHWHGIRIENEMDGVVGLTQDAVKPDGSMTYDFTVPDAGTYWYHPHNRTWEQMARGLYGPLIIDEPTPPEVDQDIVFLIDDWRLTQEAQIDESFGQMMDWSHGGRMGNWVTVNGRAPTDHAVKRHERIRLRLINVANSRIFELGIDGLEGMVMALDGQPLETPVLPGRITLAPAQRMDLILDVTALEGQAASLSMQGADQAIDLARFPVDGSARAAQMPPPAPLPANPVPALGDLQNAKRVDLLMEGGAMGQMRGAIVDGEMQDMRTMASNGNFWALNGVSGLPDEPLLVAKRGETVIIKIINDSVFGHAMHLHGFHFRQIANDAAGPLRDTLLVERAETVEIAFVADNLGDWLLHCHMLEHTAAGMLTWIKVV